MSDSYDLIVVGEGMTGLTCANHAASLGLRVATIEANVFGGLVINIAELEDYTEHGSGVDLAAKMMEANAEAGVTSINGTVTAIDGAAGSFRVDVDGEPHGARAVVIASGARFTRLGVPGEEEFDHRGVSQCADCDGPMFQGEHVVVVGGADSAFQEAITLAGMAGKVTLLMRGASSRARPSLIERVRSKSNVTIVPETVVEAITGTNTVDGIRVRSTKDGSTSKIDCAGVFVFIGLTPNSEPAPAAVQRSASGHIVTDANLQTVVPGIFAAGAVRAGYSGRLTDAEAEGRKAAEVVARGLGTA